MRGKGPIQGIPPASETNEGKVEIATNAEVVAKTATNKVLVCSNINSLLEALGIGDAFLYKGIINCSGNPNYPVADAGHVYKVSVAGKIGGASGITVEVGDTAFCSTDGTASGDHATVGANWNVLQFNIVNAGDLTFTPTGDIVATTVQAMGAELDTKKVAKALFDANTILTADSDNAPAALTVAAQRLVGRITAGNITDLTAAEVRTLLNVANSTEIQVHGFVDNTETTISFNDGSYVFTLTDVGAGWSYYRNGIRYTISGNKTTTLAGTPPSANDYYVVIDTTDGTLSVSTTKWNITDSKVLVAIIRWNNSLTPKYLLVDERHTVTKNKNDHAFEHFTYGTRLESSGAISGYTLGSDVDANKQFDIAQTKIWDEDLPSILAAITGGSDNYHIAYRTGASTWVWEQSAFPFDYTGEGYINYDNAGTMMEGQNNKYYTTYLIATNQTGLSRFIIIHGQSEFSSLIEAKAEQFTDLTLTGLDIAEGVAIWKFIWDTSAGYTSTGKCELEVEPIKVDTNVTTQPAPPGLGTMSTQDADDVAITGGEILVGSLRGSVEEIIQASSDTLEVNELKGTIISNYGQGSSDNEQQLPTAAEGMSCVGMCGTAQAAHYFRFKAGGSDKIYLDGVAGSDNGHVSIAVPVVGAMIVFFTFQTGASVWDWAATIISGTWVAG